MYLILKKHPGRSIQTGRIDLNQRFLETVYNEEVTVIRLHEGLFQRLAPKVRVTEDETGLTRVYVEEWRNYVRNLHERG